MAEVSHVFVYGLLAAVSPTVLLATLVVLGSGRGRLNGLVFLIAFTIGQSLAYILALLIGSAITIGDNTAGNVEGALELAAGVALVVIAWLRRSSPVEAPVGPPRSQALFARLSHVRPAISFGVGMPLGIGVKRLVITFLAAATVASAELSRNQETLLGIEYVAVATVVVWCPVLIYLVLGPRADGVMARTRAWITSNERKLLVSSAFVLGLFLIVDGVAQLL